MELLDLQKKIVTSTLSAGAYVFTGVEGAVQHEYINQIAAKLELKVYRLDTVSEAVTAMSRGSFSTQKKLFVVFNDLPFTKAENAWNTVFSGAERTPHILILQYPKLDRHSKFYKKYKDILCEFNTLDDEVATRYVLRELNNCITEETAKYIAYCCENDYGRIQTECDKINQYMPRFAGKPEDIVCHFLKKGLLSSPISDITFDFVDAILYRDNPLTAQYLQQAKIIDEPPLLLASQLYIGFKGILMVQGLGEDRTNVAQRTGLTPYQARLATEKMGNYTLSELQRNLRYLQEVEYGIKTGKVDPLFALDEICINCLREG